VGDGRLATDGVGARFTRRPRRLRGAAARHRYHRRCGQLSDGTSTSTCRNFRHVHDDVSAAEFPRYSCRPEVRASPSSSVFLTTSRRREPGRLVIFRPHVTPTRPTAVYDHQRGSAASRGYDHRWRAFRASVLASNPLCADCMAIGRLTPATDIHQVVKLRDAPDRRLDADNVLQLCPSCHATRTARGEQATTHE
jgi:5-methylcytosine-specific restriction enzyme A